MNVSGMEAMEDDRIVLHRVKFLILIALQIPAIVVYLLIFWFLITHPSVLRAPQNQGVLLLLIVNFLEVTGDLPMVIHFYYLGRVHPATPAFCTWWTFFEYTLNVSSEILMATISVQRHMLIFNSYILRIRTKRLLLHHLPLLLSILYPTLLYLALVVLYPCDGTLWDYSENLCGLTNCYLVYNNILAVADWAIDNGIPVAVIVVANATLVVRVVRQKRQGRRTIAWRNQRPMTLQLLSISCLYLIAWLPNTLFGIIEQVSSSDAVVEFQSKYIIDILYLVCLLTPWVCLAMLPPVKKWLWERMRCRLRSNNIVVPMATAQAVTWIKTAM